MSKSFLNLVAIVLVAMGFVACGSDDKLSASDRELLSSAKGYLKGVKYQLKQGANVNAKDKNGWTALIFCIDDENTYDSVCEYLIEQGADVNVKTKSGWTPLMFAAEKNRRGLVETLLKKGADINAKNKNGYTAVDLAGHLTKGILYEAAGISE